MGEGTCMASTNLNVEAALVFPFYWPAGSFPTNLAINLLLRGGGGNTTMSTMKG